MVYHDYEVSRTEHIMALTDLIVTNKVLSEDIIENILKGKVELIQEEHKVFLTREGLGFPNRLKILLFLTGAKAWELIDKTLLTFSPSDLEKELNIQGNSIRPILKELADNLFIVNEKGKYRITSKGVYELENLLKKSLTDVGSPGSIKKIKSKIAKATASSTLPSKTNSIAELIENGFFASPKEAGEIIAELGRMGVTMKPTSLPSFLLPLVRNKTITRDYKDKNKRKVWVYSKNDIEL